MALDIEKYSMLLGKNARSVSREMRRVSHAKRKKFLTLLAGQIAASSAGILEANSLDVAAGRKAGLSSAMLDRLALDEKRLGKIAFSVREIARLPDPVGRKISSYIRKDGLKIDRISVPIGSIFFIFESRPNVTVDGAALCIKSGNAVVLRGGKESVHSNKAFAGIIRASLKAAGIPENAVQLVNRPDYAVMDCLLKDEANIDVVIPRGGEKLIRAVAEKARMPVIKHYKGVCHIYMDKTADAAMAEKVIVNAKTQRPGVCNAMETLLLDRHLNQKIIIRILDGLTAAGAQLIGCPASRKVYPKMKRAVPADWDEEYLDVRLSVKLVDGVEGAIDHIGRHGSGHTDAVLTKSKSVQARFIEGVDSSSVMVNASTRFSDGGEYGLGAEVGISTDKLHARGPMGIESLTTYQWRVYGKGHVRK